MSKMKVVQNCKSCQTSCFQGQAGWSTDKGVFVFLSGVKTGFSIYISVTLIKVWGVPFSACGASQRREP